MRYRLLGSSELRVSEVGFGAMSLGLEPIPNTRILHIALEKGINFFDTADLYDQGQNELSLGKAFKGIRDQVFLASKVGNVWREDGSTWDWNPSKKHIKSAIHASLKRLQTDYLDLYQLHGGTIDDPIDDIILAFEELQQEGWIRYYGISSIRPNVIREYLNRSNIVSVMMQYSLLDRRAEELFPLLEAKKVNVIVRGAVAKGLVVNKAAQDYLDYSADEVTRLHIQLKQLAQKAERTSAQLALGFVLAQPVVASVVAGASAIPQVMDNAQTMQLKPLAPEILAELREITKTSQYQQHR